MRSGRVRVFAVVVLVLIVGGVGWFVARPPDWSIGPDRAALSPAERVAAMNNIRGLVVTLVSVLSGVVVAGYGVYRYYLDKDKQRLDEDKHLTGLFDSATARLESDDAVVRAGGVRTLHRLMMASAQDHDLVLRTLSDVLHRRAKQPSSTDDGESRPPRDVLAALDSLRERPERPERRPLTLKGVYLPGADLRQARLGSARLARATLDKADLTGADLTDADLTEARLPEALLAGAQLPKARLDNAVLSGCDLTNARLTGASLRRARCGGATLTGADLSTVDLTDADLRGTDLSAVQGLTDASVRDAVVDNTTTLPSGVRHPKLHRES